MAEGIKQEVETAQVDEKAAARGKALAQTDGIIKDIMRGKFTLMDTIRAGGKDITEVSYDFHMLDSNDVMNALDSDPSSYNSAHTTSKQAFALFAAAVAKIRDQGVDATDLRTRMSSVDALNAIQIARAFYNASVRRGALSISEV